MGLFDAFKDTLQLTKNTFAVIGKNPAILKPTMKQVWIEAIVFFLVIISIIGIVFPYSFIPVLAIIVIIGCVLYLGLIFPFVKMHYRAAQCWMVYRTFSGESVTYQEGLERAKINKKDVFLLGLFDILLTALARKLKQGTQKGGLWVIVSIIMKVLGKAVEEGWDLIGHYLLPACIIQDKTVSETLPEVKNIRKNVPGALAGVFGFDFAGDLIGRFLAVIWILLLFIGFMIMGFTGSWIPVAVIVALIIAMSLLIHIFVSMVKTIYFTLFYMSITMPEKISKDYRAEVTGYLLSNKGRRGTAGRPLGNI